MEWKMYNSSEKDVFGIGTPIKIFITKEMGEAELRTQWRYIRDLIANEQKSLNDDFERWNFYLFYRLKGVIDVSLRHLIEHDTISSRKIIVPSEEYGENDFDSLIEKYIKYTIGPEVEKEMPVFEKDIEAVKVLRGRD